MRLSEGDRSTRHRLLVVGAQDRQAIPDGVERLAEPGDIAVAEDRPDSCEQGLLLAVGLDALRTEIASQGLRHRQPDRSHRALPLRLRHILARNWATD